MANPPSTHGGPVAPASTPLGVRSGLHVRRRAPAKFSLKVRHKAMMAIGVVVCALVGIMLMAVEKVQRRHLEEQVLPELVEVGRAYLKLQETQFRLLQVIAQNLAEAPRLKAAVEAIAEEAQGMSGDALLPAAVLHQLLEQLPDALAATQADIGFITDQKFRQVARARRADGSLLCERQPAAEEVEARDARTVSLKVKGGAKLAVPAGNLLLCGTEGTLVDPAGQRLHDGSTGTALSFAGVSDDPEAAPPVCYWVLRGEVYQVCAAPLRNPRQGAAPLGWFAIGFRMLGAPLKRVKGVLRRPVFVEHDGKVVASSESKGFDQAVQDALADARWAPGSPNYTRTLGAHDTAAMQLEEQTYSVLRLPLGQGGSHLLAMISLNKALEPFMLLRRQLYTEALWVLGIALAMSWLLGRRLVKPIETLTAGMRRVADGDLKVELAVGSADEIGELSSSFNLMVQGLYEREHLSRMVSQSALGRVRQTVEGGDSYQLAKRIEVTVLFSDVRDFTTLSEKLSPEEVVQLLNEHFEEVGRIIHRYQGDIDKFIGDAVMATFHATEQRDHAEAAVLAAMEMQELVRRRNEERRAAGRLSVEIGVGLNSGAVVQGSVGTEERVDVTVLGDVVNVASRLESFCKQGKYLRIVISEATHERVRHLVDAELMAESRVKGKLQEVQMYEVRGLASREDFRAGIKSGDPVRRLACARILARGATDGETDQILTLLADSDPSVRQGVASLTPHLESKRELLAHRLAAKLTNETEGSVMEALLDALARTGDHRHVEATRGFLADARPEVRAAAVRTLGALGGRGAVEPLQAALDDADPVVVTAAARALVELSLWDVLPKLTARLGDPLPRRRTAAARAIADLAPALADRRLALEVHRRRDPGAVWFLDELSKLTATLAAHETDIEDVRNSARMALRRLSGA